MVVDEFFATLGMEVDEGSFLKGFVLLNTLHDIVHDVFDKVKEVVKEAFNEIKNLAPETAALGEKIRLAAMEAGVTTDAFQELAFASNTVGVSAEELSAALFRMSRASYDARQGGEGAAEAFRGLLSLDQIKKLKPDEMFEAMAEKLGTMTDVQKRNNIAIQVFGRGMGAKMIPLLNKGKEGIAELREEAHKFGKVMSAEAIAKAQEYTKTERELQEAIEGVKTEIGESLLDTNTWKKGITDFILANRAWIVSLGKLPFRAIRGLINLVIRSVKWLANALDGAAQAFMDIFQGGSLIKGLLGLGTVIGAVMIAVELLGAEAIFTWMEMLGPILAVVAGVVVLLAWLEDLQTFFEGGDSVIGDFIDSIADSFDGIWDFLLGFARWIINGLFGADALAAVDEFAKAIVQKIGKAWDWVKDKAAAVAKFLHLSTDANASMGGGASPAASAASSVNTSKDVTVNAPTVNAPVTVNAAPGQSAAEVGHEVAKAVDERLQKHLNDAQAHLEG